MALRAVDVLNDRGGGPSLERAATGTRSSAYFRVNAWALIAVGAVQAVAGTAAAIMNFHKG